MTRAAVERRRRRAVGRQGSTADAGPRRRFVGEPRGVARRGSPVWLTWSTARGGGTWKRATGLPCPSPARGSEVNARSPSAPRRSHVRALSLAAASARRQADRVADDGFPRRRRTPARRAVVRRDEARRRRAARRGRRRRRRRRGRVVGKKAAAAAAAAGIGRLNAAMRVGPCVGEELLTRRRTGRAPSACPMSAASPPDHLRRAWGVE